MIADDIGIHEYTYPHHRSMIPYTFVLEPGLKVYDGYWYWGRPSVAELHQDLREVTRRVRPDWQIDTEAMREKREAGDKTDFYPYGKSWREVFARMAGAVDQFE